MNILVTGSSGHLGEALIRTLRKDGHRVQGIDAKPSDYTDITGDIADHNLSRQAVAGKDAVIHTASLHKPHVATHTKQQFVDTNITGTLNLLEECKNHNVRRFIMTSTTSAFGDALTSDNGSGAVWIDEEVIPRPKNIYGVTKLAAENLCELYHRNSGLNCIVLRTSRFFPEEDDQKKRRTMFSDDNLKANELLYRRADIEDMVSAHLAALQRADAIGFGKYVVSSNTPFTKSDLADLGKNAGDVLSRYFPSYREIYKKVNWQMLDTIDRVYCNEKAKKALQWSPKYDFAYVLDQLENGRPIKSPLAREIGFKGYHDVTFTEGPYPVES
ncbi:NAD-dependent epimerase/dehydratase family protein [Mucilaginibacter sp. HD30]